MNPSKILDLLADQWSRHAPTVFVHVLLFLLVRFWVLDPDYAVDSEPLWKEVKFLVGRVLAELGFQKIEIGYVLAVLLLIYLTVIQWLAYFVSSLRFFEIRYRERINPDLMVHAGSLLRTEPEVFRVLDESGKLVESYLRQFRDQEKPEPFEWMSKQVDTWARYYGLALIAFFITFWWYWNGAAGAKSPATVFQLMLAILLFAVAARYKARKNWSRYRENLRYAALHEHYRERDLPAEPWDLRHLREEILRADAKFYRWFEHYPAVILRNWIDKLPRRLRERLKNFLAPVPRNEHFDWELLCSQKLKQEEEQKSLPAALNVERYKAGFSGLLECEGSGLCLLVDEKSGLAPSVPGGGSVYSFATRSYKGHDPKIHYYVHEDRGETIRNLRVQNFSDTWGFLVDIGEHPLELIVQGNFPLEPEDARWWNLTRREKTEKQWQGDMFHDKGARVFGVEARDTLPAKAGHSYIYRCKTFWRMETIVAFQCFFIEGSNHLLMPWIILDVIYDRPSQAVPLPWWKPRAWTNVFRKPDRLSPKP